MNDVSPVPPAQSILCEFYNQTDFPHIASKRTANSVICQQPSKLYDLNFIHAALVCLCTLANLSPRNSGHFSNCTPSSRMISSSKHSRILQQDLVYFCYSNRVLMVCGTTNKPRITDIRFSLISGKKHCTLSVKILYHCSKNNTFGSSTLAGVCLSLINMITKHA